MTTPLLILIAGPYRSGTGDDPTLLARNLARLEEAAWPVFRSGHIPMIGEWVALPVLRSAGATGLTDPLAGEVMYPTAHRLLQHCDGVLRLPGTSAGADQDVAIARERGLPVWFRLEDIPGYVPAADRATTQGSDAEPAAAPGTLAPLVGSARERVAAG